MPISPGARLGSYEVLSLLGAGGMGEVYKARDTRLDRMVAIKVLPSHLADKPQLRERFEREAETIAKLNHPHICTLYDIGEQDCKRRRETRPGSAARAAIPGGVKADRRKNSLMKHSVGECFVGYRRYVHRGDLCASKTSSLCRGNERAASSAGVWVGAGDGSEDDEVSRAAGLPAAAAGEAAEAGSVGGSN